MLMVNEQEHAATDPAQQTSQMPHAVELNQVEVC